MLLQLVVKGLSQCNIDVTHTGEVQRGNVPEWLEKEFQRAVAVLVVCNQQLHQEWNQQGRGSVIAALRHLIYAFVGKPDIYKTAVVLLRANDDSFIPTSYLEDTRRFIVNKDKVEDIAHFVKEIPLYAKPQALVCQ